MPGRERSSTSSTTAPECASHRARWWQRTAVCRRHPGPASSFRRPPPRGSSSVRCFAASRTRATAGWTVLALLGLGVLGAFAVISWSEHVESRRRRAGGWENRVLDGVLAPLSTRDWYLLVVPFALAGRLDWLVLGAAVGSHVFWIAALVLLGRTLRRARASR